VLTLALRWAYVARLTRASLLEVLSAHYVRSARAGPGTPRVLWRHALRPALMPVVSYLGPAVAFVMTGSLVIETVFGLPASPLLVEGAIRPRLSARHGHDRGLRRAHALSQPHRRPDLRMAGPGVRHA